MMASCEGIPERGEDGDVFGISCKLYLLGRVLRGEQPRIVADILVHGYESAAIRQRAHRTAVLAVFLPDLPQAVRRRHAAQYPAADWRNTNQTEDCEQNEGTG